MTNILGWSTNRKLIVFESDDWGSIRTRSKRDYELMLSKGLAVDRSHFTRNDSLESNMDLENLFEILSRHKDLNGSTAVFTPMCVVANPNFELIQQSNFNEYHYESFTDTCVRYPNHERVHQLWLEGINDKIFVPQFHGREHLNVDRWMRSLKKRDRGIQIMFEHQSIGARQINNQPIPEHLAAFNPEFKKDIENYPTVIRTGLDIFESICGYKAKYFIASNIPEPKVLERVLLENGIEYLSRYKFHKYPMGNNIYKNELNWLGRVNKLGQYIITRNCGFEPSDALKVDWVDSCLAEIRNAFYWNKPAVISTHRVNYISSINEKNGAVGLSELDKLLKEIGKNWPEVEYITTEELGGIIKD